MSRRRVTFLWAVAFLLAVSTYAFSLHLRPAGPASEGGWTFETCTGARNAGVTPTLEQEDTGYHRVLDDDGDGIACEPGEGPEH